MSFKAILVLVDKHGAIFCNGSETPAGMVAADRLTDRINRGSIVSVVVNHIAAFSDVE